MAEMPRAKKCRISEMVEEANREDPNPQLEPIQPPLVPIEEPIEPVPGPSTPQIGECVVR